VWEIVSMQIGDKVKVHPEGTTFIIIEIHNRLAKLRNATTGELYPLTPISILYKVED
jgi:hypothetical protein